MWSILQNATLDTTLLWEVISRLYGVLDLIMIYNDYTMTSENLFLPLSPNGNEPMVKQESERYGIYKSKR